VGQFEIKQIFGSYLPRPMIQIEDEIHAESNGQFPTFADAMAELRRRAEIPWDAEPNRAPCTGWKKCGREYALVEYDDCATHWKKLRSLLVLKISSRGVVWTDNAEHQWASLIN
jgi:hypothetical protein